MATTKGNVIVGQSGGPTAVINSSLAGVYKTAKDRGAKKIYGMLHGIQGLLEERYVDLSKHITSDLDIELLKRTPHPIWAPAAISFRRSRKIQRSTTRFSGFSISWRSSISSTSEETTPWTPSRSFPTTRF